MPLACLDAAVWLRRNLLHKATQPIALPTFPLGSSHHWDVAPRRVSHKGKWPLDWEKVPYSCSSTKPLLLNAAHNLYQRYHDLLEASLAVKALVDIIVYFVALKTNPHHGRWFYTIVRSLQVSAWQLELHSSAGNIIS